MSEIDLPERLKRYGADRFTLKRIALTKDDLRGLPSYQAKTKSKDSRYQWYVKKFGKNAYELDAMNANGLRDRVGEGIREWIDFEKWQRRVAVQRVELESIEAIACKMELDFDSAI